MGMSVDDQIGPVLEDRRRQPVAAEEGEDLARLTFEGCLHRRVVKDDEADRAGGHRAQGLVERFHLGGRLGVDRAQRGLPEVRQVPLREQIEWQELRGRTSSSPFARAFFVIADGLGISAVARQPAP